MWEQYTYRKDFQLFSPGSVVSSAQNQSHLQHQVSILPTPRLPLLTRQLMHHPPPFHLHPYQLPHQREAPCKSIHWRCSTRHAHSVALSSTGRANLKVLPTSHAGQSSVLVSVYFTSSVCRLISHIVNNQLRGSGQGRNQKVAKEEAARHAFHALGWGSERF